MKCFGLLCCNFINYQWQLQRRSRRIKYLINLEGLVVIIEEIHVDTHIFIFRWSVNFVHLSTMKKHIVRSVGFIVAYSTFEWFDSCMDTNVLRQSCLSCKAFAASETLKFTMSRMRTRHVLSKSGLFPIPVTADIAHHVFTLVRTMGLCKNIRCYFFH